MVKICNTNRKSVSQNIFTNCQLITNLHFLTKSYKSVSQRHNLSWLVEFPLKTEMKSTKFIIVGLQLAMVECYYRYEKFIFVLLHKLTVPGKTLYCFDRVLCRRFRSRRIGTHIHTYEIRILFNMITSINIFWFP